MPSDKIYNLHCLVCGDPFRVTRIDAKTCSKICRIALYKLTKYGAQPEETTPDEDAAIKEKQDQIKSQTGPALLTSPHKEDKEPSIPSQTEAVLKQIAEEKKKPKRIKKAKAAPKNDKNLLPGEVNKSMRKLIKRKNKGK